VLDVLDDKFVMHVLMSLLRILTSPHCQTRWGRVSPHFVLSPFVGALFDIFDKRKCFCVFSDMICFIFSGLPKPHKDTRRYHPNINMLSSSGSSSSNVNGRLIALKDPTGMYGCYTESYHQLYARSAWIVVRRFACRLLTEGDVATVFSQFGEVVDVRCQRSHKSGDIIGSGVFVRFQSTESAALAADNMNSGKAPNGHKVFLTAECKRLGIALAVDRCDESEVPQLGESVETYGEWYRREMLGLSP
jgi:hypothetical protein